MAKMVMICTCLTLKNVLLHMRLRMLWMMVLRLMVT